jgi:hypothetical protein
MDSEGKQEINLSHFKDFPKFRLVRIDGRVVTYERLYENPPTLGARNRLWKIAGPAAPVDGAARFQGDAEAGSVTGKPLSLHS